MFTYLQRGCYQNTFTLKQPCWFDCDVKHQPAYLPSPPPLSPPPPPPPRKRPKHRLIGVSGRDVHADGRTVRGGQCHGCGDADGGPGLRDWPVPHADHHRLGRHAHRHHHSAGTLWARTLMGYWWGSNLWWLGETGSPCRYDVGHCSKRALVGIKPREVGVGVGGCGRLCLTLHCRHRYGERLYPRSIGQHRKVGC